MFDDDEIERMPASREIFAIVEKVKFSENLNKLFWNVDEIFNKNDEQKPSFDDAESLGKPDEMTIPQAQVIYKELNDKESFLNNWRFSQVEIVELTNLGYMQRMN